VAELSRSTTERTAGHVPRRFGRPAPAGPSRPRGSRIGGRKRPGSPAGRAWLHLGADADATLGSGHPTFRALLRPRRAVHHPTPRRPPRSCHNSPHQPSDQRAPHHRAPLRGSTGRRGEDACPLLRSPARACLAFTQLCASFRAARPHARTQLMLMRSSKRIAPRRSMSCCELKSQEDPRHRHARSAAASART
jgi:hypothetical protein